MVRGEAPRVLWREASAQHFGNPGGHYVSTDRLGLLNTNILDLSKLYRPLLYDKSGKTCFQFETYQTCQYCISFV